MKSILTAIFLLCGLTFVLWANPCQPDEFFLRTENEKVGIQYWQGDPYYGDYPIAPLLRAEVEIISENPLEEEPYKYGYIVHRVFELTENDPLSIEQSCSLSNLNGSCSLDPCVAPGTYAYLFLSYDFAPQICDAAPNYGFVTVAEHGVSCSENARELDMSDKEFKELTNIYPGSHNDFDFVTKDGDDPNAIPDEDADLNEEPEQENNDDFTDAPVSDNESTPDEVNDADDHSVKNGGCSLTVL